MAPQYVHQGGELVAAVHWNNPVTHLGGGMSHDRRKRTACVRSTLTECATYGKTAHCDISQGDAVEALGLNKAGTVRGNVNNSCKPHQQCVQGMHVLGMCRSSMDAVSWQRSPRLSWHVVRGPGVVHWGELQTSPACLPAPLWTQSPGEPNRHAAKPTRRGAISTQHVDASLSHCYTCRDEDAWKSICGLPAAPPL